MKLTEILKEVITENGKPLQRIEEGGLNRILDRHYVDGFIIISAYRNERKDEENKKLFDEMKQTVKSSGYSYIPVYGGFIEDKEKPTEKEVNEPALIIPNQNVPNHAPHSEDNLKEMGIELCKEYGQDSFLYKPKNQNDKAYYINKNGDIEQEFTGKKINDLTQVYFTKLHNPINAKYKPFYKADRRFTFTEQLYLNKSPRDMNEAVKRYGEQFFNLQH